MRYIATTTQCKISIVYIIFLLIMGGEVTCQKSGYVCFLYYHSDVLMIYIFILFQVIIFRQILFQLAYLRGVSFSVFASCDQYRIIRLDTLGSFDVMVGDSSLIIYYILITS